MSGIFLDPTVIGSGSAPIGPAGGELSGTYPNPEIVAINGATVPDSGSIPVGSVLQISSSDILSYGPINLAGGTHFVSGVLPFINLPSATTGTLGLIQLSNDLGGTNTSPKVLQINGASVPTAGSLTTGNILQVTGAGTLGYSPLNLAGGINFVTGSLPAANQISQSLSGDLSGSTSAATVIKINGATVPVSGALTTGNILQVTGSGALSYAAINLAGGSNFVTGALPTANQVSQSLSGDLSGTTASATVNKINGTSVVASPTANQILIASGSTSSSWSLISDSNISPSAAIASTKLLYSDVSSPSLGATTIQGAIDAIKTQAVAPAIQRLTQNVTTGNLQALGAVSTGTINIGSALPANARLLGAEINTTQILAGLGLATALATVQGGSDTVGSIITGASVLTTGYIGMNGTNQYLSRGGQQLTVTVVLTGALFSALTAGALTVNIFYAVVA